ncbi:diacylglycerol kinase A-like [Lucilia sericata]|uniref:diacylglycerol kinase A-like n=1 Tax=Lucilia sericata TaxID=13632 RepID=UPI0018A82351|nr:diacylglycerol kinase A-like [Lucilia sericata]
MEWEQIIYKARLIKERFQRSYKCINTDRDTKQETVNKHFNILVQQLEQLRVLFNVNYSRLTQAHKTFADSFYLDIREKLLNVATRKGLKIQVPQSIHEQIEFVPLPEIIEVKQNQTSSVKMTQTVVEFLNTASKLIPDFDGSAENLQSFLDALNLVGTIRENHEAVAIQLVKTKLRGTARNLISDETTLSEIIAKLSNTVKGESVDVVTAKLMNVRQLGKTATAYAKEIEDLTRKLETSYIKDGLPTNVATKYATNTATKAIIKNVSNDRVKLIMESGTFHDLNEVMSKFISSCTEAYGQPNSILAYSRIQNRPPRQRQNSQFPKGYNNRLNNTRNSNQNNPGNISQNYRRNNNNNNNRRQWYQNNTNNTGNHTGNRNNNYRGRNQNNRINTMVTENESENDSENGQDPQDTQ